MLTSTKDDVIELAVNTLKLNRESEPDDPLLVIFWNDNRLQEINPNSKQMLLDFFTAHHGQLLSPMRENFVFFKEPSLLAECREEMKRELPWAFVASQQADAILGVNPGVPVADSVVIYKTHRVKPDISKFDFFLLN
jgi:hypothetical protein